MSGLDHIGLLTQPDRIHFSQRHRIVIRSGESWFDPKIWSDLAKQERNKKQNHDLSETHTHTHMQSHNTTFTHTLQPHDLTLLRFFSNIHSSILTTHSILLQSSLFSDQKSGFPHDRVPEIGFQSKSKPTLTDVAQPPPIIYRCDHLICCNRPSPSSSPPSSTSTQKPKFSNSATRDLCFEILMVFFHIVIIIIYKL